VTADENLRQRVDGILAGLVKEFDAEEAPLRRELDAHQDVIDHGGDLAAAKRATVAAERLRAPSVDFLSLLTNAAFFPKKLGTTFGTRQLAVALARDWIVRADRDLAEANRRSQPESVRIELEHWSGDLADGTPLAQMESSLRSKIKQKTDEKVAEIQAGTATYVGFIVAAVFFLVSILTMVHKNFGGGVVFLLFVVGGAMIAITDIQKLPAKREAVRAEGKKRTKQALLKLRQATAEYTDLVSGWEAHDAKADQLSDYLATINPSAYLSRPVDQIHEVLS
jgi:hypothetical protein